MNKYSDLNNTDGDVIRVPIKPHYAGGYRLEYDGKYVTLFGRDKNYPGFKFSEDDEDWYEEMVLVPVVIERRRIIPKIASVDDKWIYIELINKPQSNEVQ